MSISALGDTLDPWKYMGALCSAWYCCGRHARLLLAGMPVCSRCACHASTSATSSPERRRVPQALLKRRSQLAAHSTPTLFSPSSPIRVTLDCGTSGAAWQSGTRRQVGAPSFRQAPAIAQLLRLAPGLAVPRMERIRICALALALPPIVDVGQHRWQPRRAGFTHPSRDTTHRGTCSPLCLLPVCLHAVTRVLERVRSAATPAFDAAVACGRSITACSRGIGP